MIRPMTVLALTPLLLALVLGGCTSGAAPRSAAPRAASAPTTATRSAAVVAPQVMAPAGLEGVIGSSASALTQRFGPPRIDLVEGDARKLQFTGPTCVLDVYLYPLTAGADLTATHVSARLRQGGALIDPKACIREAELR